MPNAATLTRSLFLAAALTTETLVLGTAASADSTPVGPLPKGPVTRVAAPKGSLIAVALPGQRASSGLVWRLARPVASSVAREVSEADVGTSVVIVYRLVGTGRTSIVYALTRGDTSRKAVRAVTYALRAT